MDKPLAVFFYEQCAGTTAGHMAMIPNNPVLFALVKAHTGNTKDNTHSATQVEFAAFLQEVADTLTRT